MDFKVATLLKSSSGNKKLENLSARVEVERSERNFNINGKFIMNNIFSFS